MCAIPGRGRGHARFCGPSAPAPMDPAAVMRAGSYVYDDDDDDAGINYYPA